jgi:hypothetical protein
VGCYAGSHNAYCNVVNSDDSTQPTKSPPKESLNSLSTK